MSPIGLRCPSCGRRLGKTAVRCLDCGAAVDAPGAASRRRWPGSDATAEAPPWDPVEDPASGDAALTGEAGDPGAGAEEDGPGTVPAPEVPPENAVPADVPPPPPPGVVPLAPGLETTAGARTPVLDLNLVHAVRRAVRRNAVTAALAGALLAAAAVLVGTLLVGLLDFAAHTQSGCTADATLTNPGTCHDGGQAPGLLTDWNAVLWSVHGAGVVFGAGGGASTTVRVPLAGGILLVAAALFVAGRASVALVAPRRPRDILVRAVAIAVTYTVVMVVAGAALTARGNGLDVGPDYGLLVLWGLGLGFVGAVAGVTRRLFGPLVPRMPLEALRVRAGRLHAPLEAAVVATGVALALSAVAAVVAMATHVDDTANVVRATVTGLTTRPFPDSAVGAVAAVVHLVLAGPTIAAWTLAYSMAIPTVTTSTPGGTVDHGLAVGSHDAWLWVVIVVPVLASLLAGYAAARLRRCGTVEGALVEGTIAGLGFAAVAFAVLVLLDGGGSTSVAAPLVGAPGAAPSLGPSPPALFYGPGLQYSLLALLLFGLVGGGLGAYFSLVLLRWETPVWVLRRYNVSRVGEPLWPAHPVCPGCGAGADASARFCASCGTPLRS